MAADTSPEDWQQVIGVNATGAYFCIQAVLPEMRRRGSGTIIQIGSTAGKRATQLGGISYNASKFALSALGTSAANEAAAVLENRELLGRLGLSVEPFGGETLLISAYPAMLAQTRAAGGNEGKV